MRILLLFTAIMLAFYSVNAQEDYLKDIEDDTTVQELSENKTKLEKHELEKSDFKYHFG